MRISDWSSDVCSSDLTPPPPGPELVVTPRPAEAARLNVDSRTLAQVLRIATIGDIDANVAKYSEGERRLPIRVRLPESARTQLDVIRNLQVPTLDGQTRSEEHKSELQSLMRITYAVFCFKKKKKQ